MKTKKIISAILSTIIVCTYAGNSVFAFDEYANNIENQHVVATYSSEKEKEDLINEIKEEHPNALIFTSIEERDRFFYDLENNFTFSITEKPSALNVTRSSDEVINDYCIRITTTLVNSINFYYSYGVRNTRFFTTQSGSPYLSYTGFTPGTECSLLSSTITKESMQLLDIKFKVHIEYYILAEGFGKVGSKDFDYHFKHDIAIGAYEA